MKLSETVYLTAVPIAGTAAAFLFELGFCDFHGIPKSLITLSPSRIVIACVAITMMAFFIHTYFSIGTSFLKRRKGVAFRMVGLGVMFSHLPFILVFTYGGPVSLWIAFAIAFCLPAIIGLAAAIQSPDDEIPFSERWWNESEKLVFKGVAAEDGLERLIEVPSAFMTIGLLLCFVCFTTGTRYAQVMEPSRALESSPTQALLLIYGDRWIFRPIVDIKERHLAKPSELLILSGSATDSISLVPINKP